MQKKIRKIIFNYTPQDFVVSEVSFIPELKPKYDDNNRITYLRLIKYDFNHFEAIKLLSNVLKISNSQITAAGIKDENAITEQLISIDKKILTNEIDLINKRLKQNDKYIFIKEILGYGNSMLSQGMLHGNNFSIRIRNADINLCSKIQKYVGNGKYFSYVNYYDCQRFGKPNLKHNNALIGKYIVKKEWRKALNEYSKVNIQSVEKLTDIPQSEREFYVSAYNSMLWNTSVNKIIKKHKNCKLVNFPYLNKLNIINKKNNEFPLIKTINAYKFDWEKGCVFKEKKERLLIVNTKLFIKKIMKDEYFSSKYSFSLDFYLPTGSYATMLIKQFLENF